MSIKSIGIDAEERWVRAVVDAVPRLRYGAVEVVVHEGRLVQIERRENVRFDEASRGRPDHQGGRATATAGSTDPSEAPKDARAGSNK
jgi:hypothetical protein